MLEAQRKKIDALDLQIAKLLEERMDVVVEVATIKAQTKLPVLDETREQKLLEKIAGIVEQPAYQPAVLAIYETILAQSRAFQKEAIDEGKV